MPEIDLQEEEREFGEPLRWVLSLIATYRWYIVLPACLVSLGTIAFLWMIPNRYTSEATLVVVAQQVPQRYVVPNSTGDIVSALQAMKQEVLSRTRLLRMIDDFGLYPKLRKMAPEQLATIMLSDIGITPLGERPQERNFDAFRIAYTTENALLAQQVTSTLTSLFINEHLRTQEEQSSNTTKFLHDQVMAAKSRLEILEARLRDFKIQHVGELPEQQQGNLGILSSMQTQLQNTATSLNRAQQQQSYLQALIEGHRRQQSQISAIIPGISAPVNRPATPYEIVLGDLTRLESQKSALLSKSYTLNHPDVVKIQQEISRTEERLKRLKQQAATELPHTAAAEPAKTPEPADDPSLTQLKGQLEANRLEIEALIRDEKRLKATIAQYENRINQTPVREQQQASLLRETESLRLEYADLRRKEQESQLATNLEKQQGGRQFRLVDAANLPLVPSSPKRLKLSLVGFAVGIVLGLGLALVMELRNTSFRTEKDLAQHIEVPFLVEVPVLLTQKEEHRLKFKHALEWLAGSAMGFVVLIAEYYVYKHG